MLSKEAILSAVDRNRVLIDVPEWGGSVWVAAISAAEKDAFDAENFVKRGERYEPRLDNVKARFLVRCLEDDDRKPLFGLHDAAALGAKSAAVIDRLYEVAARLNKVDATQEESAKN